MVKKEGHGFFFKESNEEFGEVWRENGKGGNEKYIIISKKEIILKMKVNIYWQILYLIKIPIKSNLIKQKQDFIPTNKKWNKILKMLEYRKICLSRIEYLMLQKQWLFNL